MKLKRKLMLLVLSGILLVSGVFSWISIQWTRTAVLESMAETEQEKLAVIGNAFLQVGTREEFEDMGELARDAWLKYQFRRCYQKDHILLKGSDCLENLTDYEVADISAMKDSYLVQDLGEKHLLLVMRTLPYPEDFRVLAVRDISHLWRTVEQQLSRLLAVFFLVAGGVVLTISLTADRLLSGLSELEQAAKAIGRGELGRTVAVCGKDEIGQVSEAFNQMSMQVEQQVEDLHLILGALTHEMKTPITSIMGYADSMLHMRLNEEQKKKSLESIYAAGSRMEKMSGKMLHLIGLYENDAIERKPVRLSKLWESLTEETRELCLQKRVSLQIDKTVDGWILGDEELLLVLFSNLVQNGCRASEPGQTVEISAGEVPAGEVPAEEKTPAFLISVCDHGCGISPEDLPNVTRAFYMGDKSRSRSEGGSGLGLAISERIVKLHGARWQIFSTPGKGTSVQLEFTKYLQDHEDLQEDS